MDIRRIPGEYDRVMQRAYEREKQIGFVKNTLAILGAIAILYKLLSWMWSR